MNLCGQILKKRENILLCREDTVTVTKEGTRRKWFLKGVTSEVAYRRSPRENRERAHRYQQVQFKFNHIQ